MSGPTLSATRETELRELLHDTHAQLEERDALIERLLRAPSGAERRALEQERADLHAEFARLTTLAAERAAEAERLRGALAETERRIAQMTRTRAWRAARAWWRLRGRLRGR